MVLYRNTQQDLLDIFKNLSFVPLTRLLFILYNLRNREIVDLLTKPRFGKANEVHFELVLPLLADRLALNALPYSDSCSFRCFCKFYSLVDKPLTTSSNHSVVTFLSPFHLAHCYTMSYHSSSF